MKWDFDWVVVDRLKHQDVKTCSTRKEARSAANETKRLREVPVKWDFDWVVVDRLKHQYVKTCSTRKEARSAANELNSRERDSAF